MTYVIEVVIMSDDEDEAHMFIDEVDRHLNNVMQNANPQIPFVIEGPIERVPIQTVLQMIRDAELDEE